MSREPLVTVYVPCRNYARFLEQCVNSVFCQLYTNWELILVDEASSDGTAVLAEDLRRRHPQRTRIVAHEEPLGLQRLANKVLRMARGEYIMRLDADDWLDEGALLLMVAKLESDPSLGMVYGNYHYTDERGQLLGTERRPRLGDEDLAGHLAPHGACTMVRTRSLKAVGGYTEEINAQDGWELWYKLAHRIGAANLDAPVFYYRQHGESLSRDSKRLLSARKAIFERVAQSLDGAYIPSCIAVIAVRESYPGFEGVPYRLIGGRSLLEHALLSAAEAKRVTDVVVSSESEDVLAYAKRLAAEGKVPEHHQLRRMASDTRGSVPIRDILLHAGASYEQRFGVPPDAAAFLSIHAVNRRAAHVDKAINLLRITECDSVISVQEEREPLFSHGVKGLDLINPGRFHDLAYERERVYRFNGAVIAAWWEVLKADSLLGETIGYVEMTAEDSVQVKTSSMVQRLSSSNLRRADGD